MMTWCAMYIFFGSPVYLYLLVRLLRKISDIDMYQFVLLVIVSLLPGAREALVLMFLPEDKIVFKKKP